jgi:DNA-binding CsgD family transcriptional regulator
MESGHCEPAAVLFIRDPEPAFALEPKALEKLHGFTAAEALLAASLARGLTLELAAVERGISYETARTQLKHVFLKTGCRRQAELVALLAGVIQI